MVNTNVAPQEWGSLPFRFGSPRECCAAYLALHGAEVIGGEKPGNLINVANRKRPCGTNPYLLWKEHGPAVLEGTGLKGLELVDRGDSLLLYLYRDDLVARLLEKKAVAVTLGKLGYEEPGEIGPALARLQERVRSSADFPHEIGIFLGYPLKDVLSFMGTIRLAYSCQGPWKIFGNPTESLQLAARFRDCRCRIAQELSCCTDPSVILRNEPKSAA